MKKRTLTLGDVAKALNRSVVYLRGLQSRFELPVLSAYSPAYLAFLRTIVDLRRLNVSEAMLLQLWQLERKLMVLLHADATGSPTWFLDACGLTEHRERRLLLSNHDLGVPVPARALQLGLNFAEQLPELFAGREMGEDALRVLNEYVRQYQAVMAEAQAEASHLRAAAAWTGKRLK